MLSFAISFRSIDNGKRNHASNFGHLAHHRLELCVDQVNFTHTAEVMRIREPLKKFASDLVAYFLRRGIRFAFPRVFDLHSAETEVRLRTTPVGIENGDLPLFFQTFNESFGLAKDRRRIGSRHPSVRGHHQDRNAPRIVAFSGQGVLKIRVDGNGGNRLRKGLFVRP